MECVCIIYAGSSESSPQVSHLLTRAIGTNEGMEHGTRLHTVTTPINTGLFSVNSYERCSDTIKKLIQ